MVSIIAKTTYTIGFFKFHLFNKRSCFFVFEKEKKFKNSCKIKKEVFMHPVNVNESRAENYQQDIRQAVDDLRMHLQELANEELFRIITEKFQEFANTEINMVGFQAQMEFAFHPIVPDDSLNLISNDSLNLIKGLARKIFLNYNDAISDALNRDEVDRITAQKIQETKNIFRELANMTQQQPIGHDVNPVILQNNQNEDRAEEPRSSFMQRVFAFFQATRDETEETFRRDIVQELQNAMTPQAIEIVTQYVTWVNNEIPKNETDVVCRRYNLNPQIINPHPMVVAVGAIHEATQYLQNDCFKNLRSAVMEYCVVQAKIHDNMPSVIEGLKDADFSEANKRALAALQQKVGEVQTAVTNLNNSLRGFSQKLDIAIKKIIEAITSYEKQNQKIQEELKEIVRQQQEAQKKVDEQGEISPNVVGAGVGVLLAAGSFFVAGPAGVIVAFSVGGVGGATGAWNITKCIKKTMNINKRDRITNQGKRYNGAIGNLMRLLGTLRHYRNNTELISHWARNAQGFWDVFVIHLDITLDELQADPALRNLTLRRFQALQKSWENNQQVEILRQIQQRCGALPGGGANEYFTSK